jgi:hypothetical protein
MVYGQSNFLGSCLEHVSSCEIRDGEVELSFAAKDSFFADLLKNREQQETLRAVATKVLGQPVRICVRLESQEIEPRASRPDARSRAERDPGVEMFRRKFDGAVVDVKELSRSEQ